jgi:ketosteroid isomerase-like protein
MVTTEARTATDVVRAYFDALQQGQFDLLGALFADDVRWHQPGQGTLSGVYTGKAAVFELFGKFMQLSGGTFAIDRSIRWKRSWRTGNLSRQRSIFTRVAALNRSR